MSHRDEYNPQTFWQRLRAWFVIYRDNVRREWRRK